MPDYKKKKVKKKFSRKTANFAFDKKNKKNNRENAGEDIVMSAPDNKVVQKYAGSDNIRAVKGKKLQRRRRTKIIAGVIAFLFLLYVVMSLILPVSVGESLGNLFATIGSGEYPIEIYGAQTLDTASQKLYYYVLTDTDLCAFSTSGKEIFTSSHGYSNPVLKTSQTRAMIFDQGADSVRIFNLKGEVINYSTEKSIINADIARNGSYAVAMYSDSYASNVKVFSKKEKVIFEWNSAKDMVNSITLSPNGKYLVAATFNANDGSLNAKVSVFDTEKSSADPVFSYEISGGMVYSLTSSKNGFFVITGDGAAFVEWDGFSKTDIKSDRQASMFRNSPEGSVCVFNLNSNKSDNIITVISKKGEKISEFSFDGIISDIRFLNGHIYFVSEAKAYLYDKEGNPLSSADCGYDVVKLAVTGSQSVAAISDSAIKKIEFKR